MNITISQKKIEEISKLIEKEKNLVITNKYGGQGAFGFVLFVFEKGYPEMKYAVKVQDLDDGSKININQKVLEKCKNEANNLRVLKHKQVVQIHSDYVLGLYHFIQMQQCKYSLYDWKKDNMGSISDEQFFSFAQQILDGVEFIHSKSYVLRDLKLENILIDTKGQIKFCDFGAVKYYPDINEVNYTTGYLTYSYAPPEVQYKMFEENAIKIKQTSKGDIWAMGVCLSILGGANYFGFIKCYQNDWLIPKMEHLSDKAKQLIEFILEVDNTKRSTISEIRQKIETLYIQNQNLNPLNPNNNVDIHNNYQSNQNDCQQNQIVNLENGEVQQESKIDIKQFLFKINFVSLFILFILFLSTIFTYYNLLLLSMLCIQMGFRFLLMIAKVLKKNFNQSNVFLSLFMWLIEILTFLTFDLQDITTFHILYSLYICFVSALIFGICQIEYYKISNDALDDVQLYGGGITFVLFQPILIIPLGLIDSLELKSYLIGIYIVILIGLYSLFYGRQTVNQYLRQLIIIAIQVQFFFVFQTDFFNTTEQFCAYSFSVFSSFFISYFSYDFQLIQLSQLNNKGQISYYFSCFTFLQWFNVVLTIIMWQSRFQIYNLCFWKLIAWGVLNILPLFYWIIRNVKHRNVVRLLVLTIFIIGSFIFTVYLLYLSIKEDFYKGKVYFGIMMPVEVFQLMFIKAILSIIDFQTYLDMDLVYNHKKENLLITQSESLRQNIL